MVGLICVAKISAVRELAENEAKMAERGTGQELVNRIKLS